MQQESLISVIVPCYNQGRYLATAIESVLTQSYKHYEIIVVDDGSTDNTKAVAEAYSEVNYVYQLNQGLSAARNTGIKKSNGGYLVFLDADDWLAADAFVTNLSYLKLNPNVACVTGSHEIYYEPEQKSWLIQMANNGISYLQLLERNHISMIAAVLFQKWVFEFYRFDTTLKSCEDYDLYLGIARDYQILSHNELISIYRYHDNNMSWNYMEMLKSALLVLRRHKRELRSKTEKRSYENGMKFWKSFYSEKLYNKLYAHLQDGKTVSEGEIQSLKKYNPTLYYELIGEKYNFSKTGFFDKMIERMKDLLGYT